MAAAAGTITTMNYDESRRNNDNASMIIGLGRAGLGE